MYPLYTYGGGEALWTVMNTVSLMFQDRSLYMTFVFALCASIGAVTKFVRSAVQHQPRTLLLHWMVPISLFLLLAITPKTSLHIIDEIGLTQHYAKVDHVPMGLAFIFSKASSFSKGVTDYLETVLIPVEAYRYGKTGSMFSARLADKARMIRLKDPVMRENMKNFVHQCFTLPFVLTNMVPGKSEALKTTDILGMIEANPHHWLGSYWRGEGGETVFQYCKEGAKQARAALRTAIPAGIADLASSLFGVSSENSQAMNNKLKGYFSDGWQRLAGQASDINAAVGQEMMMNAYFEGSDDKREEFGLARRHGELIGMSAARAQAQQGFSYLISGQIVQDILPLLHTCFVCLLALSFVLIAPMTVCTGGFQTFWMWVKLVLWVHSWPIFFAAINGLSLIFLAQHTRTSESMGGGLSLLTQHSVADSAWWCYSLLQWMLGATLCISWSLMSGSAHAITSMTDGLLRSTEGFSSKLGSELADGNLSVGNQSLFNTTVASTQLAQQQLGSSFSFSERLDDGRYTSILGTDGQKIFKEDMSSLKTNIMETEDLSASLREDGARSLAASKEYSKLAGEQAVEASNALFDYSKGMTTHKDSTQSFGHTQSSGETESYQKMLDTAHKFAQSQGISDQEAFNALAFAGGAMSATASNNKHVEAAKSSGLSEQFSKNMEKSMGYMNDRKGSFSDSVQENAARNFQSSYGKMKHYEEQQGVKLAESEMYTKTASFAENRSLGLSTTITDDVLTGFADSRFGGNKEAAVRYASAHSDEFKEFAGSYHSPRYEEFKEKLKSEHPMRAQDVQKVYDSVYSPSVKNRTSHASFDQAESHAHKQGLNPQLEQKISSDIQGLQKQADTHQNKAGKTFDSKQSALQGTLNSQEKDFNEKQDETLVARSTKTAFKGVVREVSPVVSYVGKHALQPEERNEGIGTSSYHQIPRPKNNPPVQPPVKSTF